MPDPVEVAPGQWRVRIFLAEDPETGKQQRRQVTFRADGIRRARVAARQAEEKIRAELAAAAVEPTPTVAQAAERWWELWSKRSRSPTTRGSYRNILDVHVLNAPFADDPLDKVTTGQLEDWYADLAHAGRKGHGHERGLTPQTVRRIHNVLTQILEQAVRDGKLDRNPASLAHKPEARPKAKTLVPIGTLEALLAAAHRKQPARARLFAFAALTGLRRGELCGLRWSDVDVETGVLTVEVNVVRAKERFVNPRSASDVTTLHRKDPKAHQTLGIALDRQAAAIAAQQAEWQQELGVLDSSDPFLWAMDPPFVEPTDPDMMTRWFRATAKTAGVVGFSLHDLRHWQGSQMLAAGATLQDVKERLRHRSLDSTMGYLHADHTKQHAIVELLPQLPMPGTTKAAPPPEG